MTHLNSSRGPTAVRGLVIPVGLNPVEAVLRRGRFAHISEEILEGGTPAIADSDAATSVVLEVADIGIVAASLHRAPDPVDAGVLHPVAEFQPCRVLASKTSTAPSISRAQAFPQHGDFAAAGTAANPGATLGSSPETQDCKSSKGLGMKIECAWHKGAITVIPQALMPVN